MKKLTVIYKNFTRKLGPMQDTVEAWDAKLSRTSASGNVATTPATAASGGRNPLLSVGASGGRNPLRSTGASGGRNRAALCGSSQDFGHARKWAG